MGASFLSVSARCRCVIAPVGVLKILLASFAAFSATNTSGAARMPPVILSATLGWAPISTSTKRVSSTPPASNSSSRRKTSSRLSRMLVLNSYVSPQKTKSFTKCNARYARNATCQHNFQRHRTLFWLSACRSRSASSCNELLLSSFIGASPSFRHRLPL